MVEIGKIFLEKISSYNIFNNFLPGITFCYFVRKITNIRFEVEEVYVNIFIYYFLGMIISRIGSVIIEKILIKLKLIERAPYNEYLEASKKDLSLNILSETNNTYRSMLSVFLSALILKISVILIDYYKINISTINSIIQIFFLIFCLLLFFYSFKKQNNYIKERIKILTKKEEQ